MLLTYTELKKIGNESCTQGVKRIISKMVYIVPCIIADLAWKFHENPPIHFTVMLLTGTMRRVDGRPWISLGNSETVYVIITYIVPDISWKCYENLFARFMKIRLCVFP